MIKTYRSRLVVLFALSSSYATAASTTSSSAAAQSTPTASPTLVGCFSSFQPLVKQDTYQFQSSGHCWGVCSDINKAVLGLANGVSCWCGDELPAADTKVPSSKCDTPCEGYNLEDCGGGTEYFTVWLTGTEANVPNYNGNGPQSAVSSSAVSSSTAASSSSVATETGSSATIAPAPEPTSESSTSDSRTENRVKRIKSHDRQRIVLAVVLGLTAFTAIVAMIFLGWWCMRRRNRRHGRHGRNLFHRNKPPSLSEAPLAANGDAMSSITTSTYSSRRSPAFVERTGRAIAAMQLALGPKTRETKEQHISQASTSVESTRPNMRHLSTELEAQDYRNVIDHQSIETYQSPMSPTLPPQSPLASIIEQTAKHQKSMSVMVSASEIVSPVSPIPEEVSKKHTRSLMIHYPSWSEVDGFDFYGDVKDRDGAKGRQSWHPMRERKDGRYELA